MIIKLCEDVYIKSDTDNIISVWLTMPMQMEGQCVLQNGLLCSVDKTATQSQKKGLDTVETSTIYIARY